MQEVKKNQEQELSIAIEVQKDNEAPDFEVINVEGCLSSMSIPPRT